MHLILADRKASDPHDRLAHVACACVLIITTAEVKRVLNMYNKEWPCALFQQQCPVVLGLGFVEAIVPDLLFHLANEELVHNTKHDYMT